MTKVVINDCYGGFGLSDAAMCEYAKLKGITLYEMGTDRGVTFSTDPEFKRVYYPDILRDDPDLIEVVESMGAKANGPYAKLKIVEIPDDVKWQIEDYNGYEHIAEQHRTWK